MGPGNSFVVSTRHVTFLQNLSPSLCKHFKEEYDSKKRLAKVGLLLSNFVDCPIMTIDNIFALKHWALLFSFDNRTILYEAVQVEEKLVPTWRDVDVQLADKVFPIGEIKISPEEINHYAGAMKESIYNVLENNCQTWAMKLLEELGFNNKSIKVG